MMRKDHIELRITANVIKNIISVWLKSFALIFC